MLCSPAAFAPLTAKYLGVHGLALMVALDQERRPHLVERLVLDPQLEVPHASREGQQLQGGRQYSRRGKATLFPLPPPPPRILAS